MQPIDILQEIARYFRVYLPKEREVSAHTQASYNDCVRAYLPFLAETHKIDVEALQREHFTGQSVVSFIQHLREIRRNGASTCNQRLSALRSLFHYLAKRDSGMVGESAQVAAIKRKPETKAPPPSLSREQIDAIIAQTDPSTKSGARDHALLTFLSETGARASEASAVTLGDLDLDQKTVLLHGKGQRDRVVVLTNVASDAIGHYLLTRDDKAPTSPLFQSQRGGGLTRFGIYSRVKTYHRSAGLDLPSLFDQRVSPHIFRHSLVLRFIDAGVDLPTIGACLGHQDINTTSAYAHVSVSRKRAALEKVNSPGEQAGELPQWKTGDILTELQALRPQRLCRKQG